MTVTAPDNATSAQDPRFLILPRSVALVGPTPRNAEVVVNALAGEARLFGVHPTRASVMGVECVPAVADLPEVPDAAWLLVGHQRVEQAFAELVDLGVRAFFVPGLGSESGSAGPAIIGRIAARAHEVGAVVLGPNCMGAAVPGRASSWIGTIPSSVRSGHVTAIVQSGSIGEALLALGPRVGFRAIISTGAEAVTGVADYLTWAASDQQTRAVGLFLETVRDAPGFTDGLERCAAAGKPVVCLKVGRSEVAARAALAHTGAIVGSGRVLSAVLRRHGVIEVSDVPELVELLEVLGTADRPRGVRVGVVTESGGEGALFADHAERAGLDLGRLPDTVVEQIKREFPNFVAPGNPVDAWAVDDPELVYPRCIELLAASGQFDILVAQLDLSRFRGPAEQRWSEAIVRALVEQARSHAIFPAISTVHTTDPPEWAQTLSAQARVPLLRGAGCATNALARAARWSAVPRAQGAGDTQARPAAPIDGDGALTEHESATLLEAYGVPFGARRLAPTPEAAGDAARELGPPVVVKLDGPAHKARVGGVVLDVFDPQAAAQAARRMGGPVLVAKQLARGPEVFCGMKRDPQFGPVLAVGRGGTDVEQTGSTAIAVGPLDLTAARQLVSESGASVEAEQALAEVLVALSRMSFDHPEVSEIDVNPLIVSGSRAVAVDALVVLDGRKS